MRPQRGLPNPTLKKRVSGVDPDRIKHRQFYVELRQFASSENGSGDTCTAMQKDSFGDFCAHIKDFLRKTEVAPQI